MEKIKILIADDHPIFRDGLRVRISKVPEYQLVGEANDGEEALKKILQLKPDIVIMDIVMPGMDGILVTEHVKKRLPKTRVIILSMYNNREYALRAFRAGAEGYVLKELVPEDLLNAINNVYAGERYTCPTITNYFIEYFQDSSAGNIDPFDSLSLREKEVMMLIVNGKTNKDVAEYLSLSIETVKKHRKSIMKKLGVNDITNLTRLAVQKGFVSPAN